MGPQLPTAGSDLLFFSRKNVMRLHLKVAVLSTVLACPSVFASPITLFSDPLNDASMLTVTQGSFGVNLDFGPPYTHFGVNDGAGGGDYGGDTPSDRVNYLGFSGGYLEAYGLASLTNPSVVEWQGIDISGSPALEFSAAFASALQPDPADSVIIEAIIDGGAPEQILAFTSATFNGVFQLDGSGTSLTDTAQVFHAPISGTGSTLTIRATFSLSASTSTGDDIAIDDLRVVSTAEVPAPGVLGLFALGLAGIGLRRFRMARG